MGFDFAELRGIEPLEAFEAVLGSTGFEFAKATDFGFVCGDDDFSADFMGDSMLAAEVGHESNPTNSEPRLQRAGLVVEAAVEDTAVVRALVATGAVLFFKNTNGDAGFAEKQFARDGEAYDAAADDKMVMFFQRQFLLGCDQSRRHAASWISSLPSNQRTAEGNEFSDEGIVAPVGVAALLS